VKIYAGANMGEYLQRMLFFVTLVAKATAFQPQQTRMQYRKFEATLMDNWKQQYHHQKPEMVISSDLNKQHQDSYGKSAFLTMVKLKKG